MLTENKCAICNNRTTFEENKRYKNLCERCCSAAWKNYEIAHGGECNVDMKRIAISKELKSYIKDRDKACLKCYSTNDLTIDHVIPLSKGGDNHHSNLQLLCRSCNSIKSNYPIDYREVIE